MPKYKFTAYEIAQALRACNNTLGNRCSICSIFSKYEPGVCKRIVDFQAADIIEELQDEIDELKAKNPEANE